MCPRWKSGIRWNSQCLAGLSLSIYVFVKINGKECFPAIIQVDIPEADVSVKLKPEKGTLKLKPIKDA